MTIDEQLDALEKTGEKVLKAPTPAARNAATTRFWDEARNLIAQVDVGQMTDEQRERGATLIGQVTTHTFGKQRAERRKKQERRP